MRLEIKSPDFRGFSLFLLSVLKNEKLRWVDLKLMKQKTKKNIKKYGFVYLLLLPVLIYFLIFSYYPLILGVIQSFQSSQLLGNAEWVGLENYMAAFQDSDFIRSLGNGAIVSLGGLAGSLILAVIFAIGLTELNNKWVRTTVQTTSYLPYLFSWTVVGGMWIMLLSPTGLVNGFLHLFGQEGIFFMTERNLARAILIFTSIWKSVGYHTVLFIAAIVSIQPNIFEAAQIDHASRFKQIRKLMLPHLIPTFKVLVILGLMGVFTNFDQILVMGNPVIMDKVRSPMFYIYENGIMRFDVGVATAASVIVLVMTMVVSAVSSKLISGKWRV